MVMHNFKHLGNAYYSNNDFKQTKNLYVEFWGTFFFLNANSAKETMCIYLICIQRTHHMLNSKATDWKSCTDWSFYSSTEYILFHGACFSPFLKESIQVHF